MIMIMIDYNWLMTLGEVALSTMVETTANDDAKSTSMPFTLTMRSCFWTWKRQLWKVVDQDRSTPPTGLMMGVDGSVDGK